MKLRNKITGEIIDGYLKCKYYEDGGYDDMACESLEELFDEWEDYTPSEPLIKDEKVRKAVRAWADVCGVDRVVNGEYGNELCAKGQQFYGAKIVLTKTVSLPRGRNYTIAELCGEEE